MDNSDSIQNLLEHAADLWQAHGESFELEDLAARSGIGLQEITDQFGGKGALLDAYFAHLVERGGATLSEMADDMSFEERAGAFCFLMLDLLEERLPLAQAHFERHAARWGAPFRERVGTQFRELLGAPDVPGINQLALQSEVGVFAVVEIYSTSVKTWLHDDSPGRDRATALVDKLVALLAATASNRTLESGIDVLRYTITAGYLPRIPFLSDWLMGDSSADADAPPDAESATERAPESDTDMARSPAEKNTDG